MLSISQQGLEGLANSNMGAQSADPLGRKLPGKASEPVLFIASSHLALQVQGQDAVGKASWLVWPIRATPQAYPVVCLLRAACLVEKKKKRSQVNREVVLQKTG